MALLLGRLLVRVFQETRGILVSAGLSFVEFRLLGIRAFGSFTSAGLEGGGRQPYVASNRLTAIGRSDSTACGSRRASQERDIGPSWKAGPSRWPGAPPLPQLAHHLRTARDRSSPQHPWAAASRRACRPHPLGAGTGTKAKACALPCNRDAPDTGPTSATGDGQVRAACGIPSCEGGEIACSRAGPGEFTALLIFAMLVRTLGQRACLAQKAAAGTEIGSAQKARITASSSAVPRMTFDDWFRIS